MSTISTPAAAGREAARRPDGRFGEQGRTDPGQLALGADPGRSPTLDRLDAALGVCGLSADDVPGLAQAWVDRYGCLDEPGHPEPGTYLDTVLGSPDYGRLRGGPWLVVVPADGNGLPAWGDDGTDWTPDTVLAPGWQAAIRVSTRNGGGNRDHWHEEVGKGSCTACRTEALEDHPLWLHDADEEGDCTYANFYFRMPTDAIDGYVAAYTNAAATRRRQDASAELAAISSGSLPPWTVLATGEERAQLAREEQVARAAILTGQQAEQVQGRVREADQAMAVLAGTAGPDGTFRGSGYGRYPGSRLAETGARFRDAQAEAGKLAAVRAELDTLPPAVRNYLAGERPEQTYTAREGSGRRARSVTRTFRPDPPFIADEDRARNRLNRSREAFDDLHAEFEAIAQEGRGRLDASGQAQRRLEVTLPDRRWAAGWPGGPADLPPRPDVRAG